MGSSARGFIDGAPSDVDMARIINSDAALLAIILNQSGLGISRASAFISCDREGGRESRPVGGSFEAAG